MNVLLIGSGGREHALAWKIKQSPLLTRLWCAPGNAGIEQIADCVTLDIANPAAVVHFCRYHRMDLVIIGPEAPLVAGLADHLRAAGIACFGPSAKAAQLEGSKAFSKHICEKYGVATAPFGVFTDAASAKAYVREKGAPIVVKADGLAAGKGVTVAKTIQEAETAIDECFGGAFGAAGNKVVVEACLVGEEVSFFALVDGERCIALGSAQDHKAVGEGDTGPNTGGMGTYSPAPLADDAFTQRMMHDVVQPIARGMVAEGMPYNGVLFVGVMVTKERNEVLEFNVRFGDPETQVLMARIEGDLLPILAGVAKGALPDAPITLSPQAALCVVMAAKGYPGEVVKGTAIRGTEKLHTHTDTLLFHAGTAMQGADLIATGGRVLGVTAVGDTLAEAQKRAYLAVDTIDWPEGFCRRDIGWRALKRA